MLEAKQIKDALSKAVYMADMRSIQGLSPYIVITNLEDDSSALIYVFKKYVLVQIFAKDSKQAKVDYQVTDMQDLVDALPAPRAREHKASLRTELQAAKRLAVFDSEA